MPWLSEAMKDVISCDKLFTKFYFLYIMSKIVSLFSEMVENNGFDPLTLCVQGRCSSQLS